MPQVERIGKSARSVLEARFARIKRQVVCSSSTENVERRGGRAIFQQRVQASTAPIPARGRSLAQSRRRDIAGRPIEAP